MLKKAFVWAVTSKHILQITHEIHKPFPSGDNHMKWQALEGLGAVNFNLGNMDHSRDHFIEALKAVGDNETASDRIKEKMLSAIHATGSRKIAAPYRGQNHMMFTGNSTGRRMVMSMHGPAEEHNQLSATPVCNLILKNNYHTLDMYFGKL